MTNKNSKILFFHVGRGGHFYNPGFVTYCGQKDLREVLQMNDDGKHSVFQSWENYFEILRTLEKRGLENLLSLLEKSADDNDFSTFEKKTGLKIGEVVYTDCNGCTIITEEELNKGVGSLEWDGEYDTDICFYLSECSKEDLLTILRSSEYDKLDVIKDFFNNHTTEKIDFNKVDEDRYKDLITSYFDDLNFEASEFYNEEETEEA